MATVNPVIPGSLVRGKRNMRVTLWPGYEVRECPDGNDRARMLAKDHTSFDSRPGELPRDELALVVSVPFPRAAGMSGTGVVQLFLQKQQRFAYTWASYLVAL